MSVESNPSFVQDLWDHRFFQLVGTYLGVCIPIRSNPFFVLEFAKIIQAQGLADSAQLFVNETWEIWETGNSNYTYFQKALKWRLRLVLQIR